MIEAFVALKTLSQTKHRLASALSEPARVALVVAMAEDVVGRLCRHPDIDLVHVICGDGWQAQTFLRTPIRVWKEADLPVSGLNAVLNVVAAKSGADGQLFIHADLPFLSHEEVSLICSEGSKGVAILCPDRHRVGTNALLRWRQQSLALKFGENSFACHGAAARAHGLDWSEICAPGLGTDIDTADDVRLLRDGGALGGELTAMLGDSTRAWRFEWCE